MKPKIGRPAGSEPTYSVAEAAEILGKSIYTIYEYTSARKLCSDGKPLLQSRRVGSSVRIPCKALEDESFSQRWEMLIDRGFSKHWRQPVKGGLTHA